MGGTKRTPWGGLVVLTGHVIGLINLVLVHPNGTTVQEWAVALVSAFATLACGVEVWRLVRLHTQATRVRSAVVPTLRPYLAAAVLGVVAGIVFQSSTWAPAVLVQLAAGLGLVVAEAPLRRLVREGELREPLPREVRTLVTDLVASIMDPAKQSRRAARGVAMPLSWVLSLALLLGGGGLAATTVLASAGAVVTHAAPTASNSPTPPPDPSVTLPTARPTCASLVQVRATIAAGAARAGVLDKLYRTWAHWNWPTMGCPRVPSFSRGHWLVKTVRPDGQAGPVVVLAWDESVGELLHPEEAGVVDHMLSDIATVDRRVSYGRGTLQLLRLRDGSCALAGHVFNEPAFYLPPSVLEALAPYIVRWGATPYLAKPSTASPGGFQVSFVGLATRNGKVRRSRYPMLSVGYDPASDTAALAGVSYGRHSCPRALTELPATAAAIEAAAD